MPLLRLAARSRTSIVPICCRDAEASASSGASASCYSTPEDIRIVPIVKSERELRKVQRQVFLAHIVVSAENPALQERPERLHVVGMHDAAHILTLAMIHRVMRKLLPAREILITGVLIGCDQFNLILVHDSINEPMHRR